MFVFVQFRRLFRRFFFLYFKYTFFEIFHTMDVELLRPGNVPISPNTVLWFEFLLQPNLLEQHLKKTNPGIYCFI